MRANKFIEHVGLDEAKRIIELHNNNLDFDYWNIEDECLGTAGSFSSLLCENNDNYVLIWDLKRIVNSWDLVNSIGGLKFAKDFIKRTGSTMDNTLENAIRDIESS